MKVMEKEKTIILSTLCIFYITYNNKNNLWRGCSVCTILNRCNYCCYYTQNNFKRKKHFYNIITFIKTSIQNYYSKLGWNQIGIVNMVNGKKID